MGLVQLGAKFRYRDGNLKREVKNLERKVDLAVRMVVDVNASRGEAYMKTNAPWTDRTGAARTGLHTVTSHSHSSHSILFSHTMDYGIWLEVKNSGEYEIIMPSIRETGRQLMGDLNHLFRRLR